MLREDSPLCAECNPEPQQFILTRKQPQGNFFVTETRSRRLYSVEMECYRNPSEAVTERRRIPNVEESDDPSIHPPANEEVAETRELRLGPFVGDGGLKILRDQVQAYRDQGFRANHSCGLHVHVDMVDTAQPDRQALLKFCRWIEDDMFRLVAPSRDGNTYSQRIGSNRRNWDSQRYIWANVIPAFRAHGTAEFRLHHGITQPDRVVEWVKLVLKLVEAGLKYGRMTRRPAETLYNLLGLTSYEREYWEAIKERLDRRNGRNR
jgi:hypothetical protein